jgi:3',5'-nucleoside bisphosphate phosphatase
MSGAETHGARSDLRPVWADLHVHTVLSPCAEVEMIPPFIIKRARELGLGVIAITDHNTAENVEAVQRAAKGSGVDVLPGMEVQTQEEAHVLCLFDTCEQALAWQEVVYAHLPPLKNREEVFGPQFVVDETGDFVRMNERLLLVSAALSIEDCVAGVNARGGLCIAAHVDRSAYSLLASLGFIPPHLALMALEISRLTPPTEAVARYASLQDWPLVTSGDAHRLSEMRASTLITWHEPSIRELALALRGEQGRKIKLWP